MSTFNKRILLALAIGAGVSVIASTQAQDENVLRSTAFNANCDATLEVESGESILDRLPDFAQGAMGVAEGNYAVLVVHNLRIELADVVLTAVRASPSPSDSGTFCLESPRIVARALPE